jgi:hypothetical protein
MDLWLDLEDVKKGQVHLVNESRINFILHKQVFIHRDLSFGLIN